MNPLLQQFLIEGRELIQEATEGLLALERDPADGDRLSVVFRAFHTLKGSSGLFDLASMTSVLHAAEDRLAGLRAGGAAMDAGLIDVLLDCLDTTGRWLDGLEGGGALPLGAAEQASILIARLSGQAAKGDADADRATEGGPVRRDEAPFAGFGERELMAALERFLEAGPGAGIHGVSYTPDPRCFFNGDDPLRLMRELDGLVALRIVEPDSWPPAAALDPFACMLAFRALVVGTGDGIRDTFRFVSDQVAISILEPESLIRIEGTPSDEPRLRALLPDLAGIRDGEGAKAMAAACAGLLRGVPEGSASASALRWLVWLLGRPGFRRPWLDAVLASLEARPDPGLHGGADAVRALILEQRRLVVEEGCPEAEFEGRLGAAATVVANALLFEGRLEEAKEIEAAHGRSIASGMAAPLVEAIDLLGDGVRVRSAPSAERAAAEEVEERPGQQVSGRMLRVDEARIEALIALVGEMMAARNRLSWLARQAEGLDGAQDHARGLRDLDGALAHLSREMHGSIMRIRMLPVGRVFQRFPRLIRDLSRRLGKPVDIVIQGEETEADKTLVEALFEPLLHLVRNSLDHGIETVEERRAAGKRVPATLTLRAFREGDRIAIEVSDDGRGIDGDAIRRKAEASGLLGADELGAMGEEDILRLIFAPGFSTTQTVSDLSGRGIGMYAVRMAVEKAGGSVGLRSAKGEGTTVLLKLPPAAAVMQVLTVTAGGERFGIPLDAVIETVSLPRDRVSRIRRHDAFVLRERVVPLRRLRDLLGMDAGPEELAPDARVLVVDVDGRAGGIEVDAFGETLSVVLKPMEGLLADISGYLGTTVLGDGRVLLVLDLKELLR